MRLVLNQPMLLKSLQAIEHAVSDRSALPILANVHLETKGQEVVLTATDLDVGIRYALPLTESSEEGSVTVPARRFTAIIRELPEEAIVIEAKNNHTTTVTCGSSRFRIPGLPPEDFPIFPPFEQVGKAVVAQAALKTLIHRTLFAMSLEETRFVLNGTLVKATGDTLALVATDGRRLASAQAHLSGASTEPIQHIVPSKTIRELSRLLEEDDEEAVTITPLKDNQLLFQFGAVTVISRLIEGQFPQYESVIPAPSTTTLTCARQLLTDAIRRVGLMTTATSQAVVFELAKDRVIVSKESTELGSAREELPATYTGQPMTIAFNPEFWLDVLKVLEADEVTIELTTPEKPAVIRTPGFLYLALPMKLA
ncbi:MAG: DNA polymerase III subunit beta [Candidatus Omnitrophica bacterium]|nr:DNA polymerase III subunit beta [Candidatus Omnitrophota bacterium]